MTKLESGIIIGACIALVAAVYHMGCCVQKEQDKAVFGVDACISTYLKAHPGYNVRDIVVACKVPLKYDIVPVEHRAEE